MMMGFIRIGSVIFYLFIFGHAGSLLSCLSISLPCAAFSSCGEQGLVFVAVHKPLIVVASLGAEHRSYSARASVAVAGGL